MKKISVLLVSVFIVTSVFVASSAFSVDKDTMNHNSDPLLLNTPWATKVVPHTWHYVNYTGSIQRMRENSFGLSPNGGASRFYFLSDPRTVNTDLSTKYGSPYPGMSDWVGAYGQTYNDNTSQYFRALGMPLTGAAVHVLEKDPSCADFQPDIYVNGGRQVGAGRIPHGFVWAGTDRIDESLTDQEVCYSGYPPTTYFELAELAAPIVSSKMQFSWEGLARSLPSDVAGNTEG